MNIRNRPLRGSVAYLDIAASILEDSGPITFEDLYQAVLRTPGLQYQGRTPRNSLYSLLWRHSRSPHPDFRLFRDGRARLMVDLVTSGRSTQPPKPR